MYHAPPLYKIFRLSGIIRIGKSTRRLHQIKLSIQKHQKLFYSKQTVFLKVPGASIIENILNFFELLEIQNVPGASIKH